MSRFLITRAEIQHFVEALRQEFEGSGSLYLIGETSQVFEGWRRWTDAIDFCAEVDDPFSFERAITAAAKKLDVRVREENPGHVIPLPEGHAARALVVEVSNPLTIWHFDPYSVALRFIARGDEPDYHLVLSYIEHGWIDIDELNRLLEALLPKFSMETIQQDPAEFRRRFKGMMQMVRAKLWPESASARTTARARSGEKVPESTQVEEAK